MDTQSVKTRLVKQANVIKGNRKIKIRIKDNRVHIKREQLQNQLDNAMRENRKLENHSSIKHKEKCQNESESEMHMLEENRYKYFSINYEMNNSEKPIKSSKQKPRFDVFLGDG
jgi:formylmethanofuran dehydrogenase subunit E